jgi:hypothetical protein
MEKQKIKTASAVAAVLLGAALVLAGCESPVLDEGQPSAGKRAGIGVLSNTASGTMTLSLSPGVIGVNEITATWSAVNGATMYDVYCDTTNPPATPVYSGITVNIATITGLSAGTTYYVQVDAKDSTGTVIDQSVGSCHTSNSFADTHLAEFIPDSLAPDCYYDTIGGDFYTFDNGGYYLIHNMSWFTPWVGYDISGEVKYIYHFGDNVSVTITQPNGTQTTFTGAAGVMIFESDHAVGDENWQYTGSGDFTANYYYGGAINGSSVQMGIAATRTTPITTPCFATLDNAINAFASVGSLETYISEPAGYAKRALYSLP